MDIAFSPAARKLGIYSAITTIALQLAYAVTLIMGLLSLTSPQQPIPDPMFTILELLIILMMPAMVSLMAVVHAWAPLRLKIFSLVSLIFMGMLAVETCCLHFVILTVSRKPELAGEPWLPLFISFEWPSIAYALDIIGWDFFFALSMLFGAMVFRGNRLSAWIRITMIASGVLSMAGLIGVATNNMQIRNIGIVGYVGVFLIVALLLFLLFIREISCNQEHPDK